MNPTELITLLETALALGTTITAAIKQSQSGQDPTPEQIAAIEQRSQDLNSQWAALKPNTP